MHFTCDKHVNTFLKDASQVLYSYLRDYLLRVWRTLDFNYERYLVTHSLYCWFDLLVWSDETALHFFKWCLVVKDICSLFSPILYILSSRISIFSCFSQQSYYVSLIPVFHLIPHLHERQALILKFRESIIITCGKLEAKRMLLVIDILDCNLVNSWNGGHLDIRYDQFCGPHLIPQSRDR